MGAFTSVKVGLFLFGFHSVPAGTWQTSTVVSWHVNRQVCAHHSPRRLRGGVFAACENLGARCYQLEEHSGAVASMAFRSWLSGRVEGIKTGRVLAKFKEHSDVCASFRLWSTGHVDGQARLLNFKTDRCCSQVQGTRQRAHYNPSQSEAICFDEEIPVVAP